MNVLFNFLCVGDGSSARAKLDCFRFLFLGLEDSLQSNVVRLSCGRILLSDLALGLKFAFHRQFGSVRSLKSLGDVDITWVLKSTVAEFPRGWQFLPKELDLEEALLAVEFLRNSTMLLFEFCFSLLCLL